MSSSLRPTLGEKHADMVIHVIGIASGAVAAMALLVWAVQARPAIEATAIGIYCLGLIAMLVCSGAYHMVPTQSWKSVLRRLDHAAIFVKIAGTYTPFALVKMGETAGLMLLAGVWGVAIAGVIAKLVLSTRWDNLAIGVYLALGWSGVASADALAAAVTGPVLGLLIAGGLLYSIGVVFFVWQSLRYQNAIWHAFVLAGTACHFGAVALAVSG